MIIKLSFLAAASVAAYAVSHRNRNNFTSVSPPENDDSNYDQEQIEGKMEDGLEAKRVSDVELLHDLVMEVQQRKLRLETKFLELYELREEKSFMSHLQRRLDEKSLEIEMLISTIDSMQTERKDLHEEVKQCALARKQLEAAEKAIGETQRKMKGVRKGNMEVKGRLLIVEEQVSMMASDEDEGAKGRDGMVEKKMKCVGDFELQVLKMKRRNKELELGKRELAVKLVAAQNKITTLSNITESDNIAKIGEEIRKLRCTNEDLSRQVETLQSNRFDMVQQLVYHRWLHTCLRLEIQSHTSNKSSNRSYDSRASPQTSTTDLSDEAFDTTTLELDSSSSSSQRSSTTDKKSGLLHSIKKWGMKRQKDARSSAGEPSRKKGLVRRFSGSMVPVKASILKNKGDNVMKLRGRRVSFSVSVRSTAQSECVFDDDEVSCCKSATNSAQNGNTELEVETHYDAASSPNVTSSCSTPNSIKDNISIPQVNRTEVISYGHQENKVVDTTHTSIMGLIAALLFLLFILLFASTTV